MTDDLVWAALDKFVVLLDDYEAAPVCAEDDSCPEGEAEAGDTEDDAEGFCDGCDGQEEESEFPL